MSVTPRFQALDSPAHQYDFSDKDYQSYYTNSSAISVIFSGYERVTEAAFSHFDNFKKIKEVSFIYFNPTKISPQALNDFFRKHNEIETLRIFNSFIEETSKEVGVFENLCFLPNLKKITVVANAALNYSENSERLIDKLDQASIPGVMEECLLSGRHVHKIPTSLHGMVKTLKLNETSISPEKVENYIKNSQGLEFVFYPNTRTRFQRSGKNV